MLRTTRKEIDSGETTSRDKALQQLLLYFGVGDAVGWKQGDSHSSGEGSDLFNTLYGSLLSSLSDGIREHHVDILNTEVIM